MSIDRQTDRQTSIDRQTDRQTAKKFRCLCIYNKMVKIPAWKKKAMGRKKTALGYRNRRLARSVIGRGLRQPVHFIKRSYWVRDSLSAVLGQNTNFSFTPKLSDLPGYTEITNLYDAYCVKGAKIEIIPKHTQSPAVFQVDSGANPGMITINTEGMIHSVLDYNSLGAGFGVNDLVQYENHRMSRTNKIHSRYFKPRVLTPAYQAGITTAYGEQKNKWISTANPDVVHYGMYGIVDLLSTSPGFVGDGLMKFDYLVTLYIACKNVR